MRRERRSKTASLAGTSDLTILAPIRPGFVPALDAVTYRTRAKRVLRALHAGRTIAHEQDLARVLSDAVERVGRIHSVRIVVLEPQDAIMLAVTYDGDFESYVRVIWQKVARLLDLIFCNTVDYVCGGTNGFEAWATWLRGRQVETPFLYAMPGVTHDDVRWHRIHHRAALRAGGQAAERLVASTALPTAEAVAHGRSTQGRDPTEPAPSAPPDEVDAKRHAFRQGLRAVVGLYRLADLYVPGSDDGEILLRAAIELLPEFAEVHRDMTPAIDRANERFREALDWYRSGLERLGSGRAFRDPPDAPTLYRPDTIQAGILEPLPDCSHGVLLLVGFASAGAMARFLERCAPSVHRAPLGDDRITVALAVTLQGLACAGLTEDEIDRLPEAFVQGMQRRAGLLGDIGHNHPQRWRLPSANWKQGIAAPDAAADDPGPRIEIDAVHVVVQLRLCEAASTRPDARGRLLARLQAMVAGIDGVHPLSLQWMARMRDPRAVSPEAPVDHFGFTDGQSDPVFEKSAAGRLYPNHVHAGEALLGYGNAADEPPVPEGEAPRAGTLDELLHNGSFLVIRKLRQDLAALERIVAAAATDAEVAIDRDTLLAKMMGRWPARPVDPARHAEGGKPLVRQPFPSRPNDFDYAGDRSGRLCPFHAHIRRANPRTSTLVEPGKAPPQGSRPPRLFRRSLSYGEPFDRDRAHDDARESELARERGLVFMAYVASLGEQFEVVQQWLSGGNSSGSSSEPGDPLLGVAEAGRPRRFRFVHDGRLVHATLDGSPGLHDEPRPIVRLEWGLYAFAPSTEGLDWLRRRATLGPASRQRVASLPWRALDGRRRIAALLERESVGDAASARLAWKAALEDADALADFDAASIWASIREHHGGVLRTAYGVLVARPDLIAQVLDDPADRCGTSGYLERMKRSFGPIFLGHDPHSAHYRGEAPAGLAAIATLDPDDEGGFARTTTVSRIDLRVSDARQLAQDDEAFRLARGLAPSETVRWHTTIEVRELIDHLLATLCEKWFGLSERGGHFARGGFSWAWRPGDPPRYPGHFVAPSRWFFQPHPEPEVERLGLEHGRSLRAAMDAYLREVASTLDAPAATTVLQSEAAVHDPGYASRTLIGLVMGFVPTLDGLLRRVAAQWAQDGTMAMLRSVHASAGDAGLDPVFDAALARAIQLRATPDLVWRTARDAFVLGDPDRHPVHVAPGEVVVLGLASATHHALEAGRHDVIPAFGGDRRAAPSARHGCPGWALAMQVMKGFMHALIASDHALRPGPVAGTIVVEGTLPAGAVDPVPARSDPGRLSYRRTARGRLLWRSPSVDELTTLSGGADDGARSALLASHPHLAFTKPVPLWVVGDSWLREVPVIHDLATSMGSIGLVTRQHYGDWGTPLADMAGRVTLKRISRDLLAAVAGANEDGPEPPAALLIGGGGNDLVGRAIEGERDRSTLFNLLKPKGTSVESAIDEAVLGAFLGGMRGHYEGLLDAITAETNAPVLIHAYDHPVPDGRKASGYLSLLLPGPWLEPIFQLRGMHDPSLNTAVMRRLIDRLNAMVAELAKVQRARGRAVHHLKLAGTLGGPLGYGDPASGRTHTDYWQDELHPTTLGCDLLARVIAAQLAVLGIAPS
jgi:deferrochelatase/peroxidase EfeB